jgi:hypothetical protein
MCKICRWIGYLSTAVGFVLIILGSVGHLFHHCGTGPVCTNILHANYFVAANSFLLLAIALFMIAKTCCCKKCCEAKEEKK